MMYLRLLNYFQFLNDKFEIIPLELLELISRLFIESIWKFKWWSFKQNYKILENPKYYLMFDREDNRLLDHLYKSDDTIKFVFDLLNYGLRMDIDKYTLYMNDVDYQFIILVYNNSYFHYEFKTQEQALNQMPKLREKYFYACLIDLSDLTIGTFNENKGKARNLFEQEKYANMKLY